jgi:predicted GNAT superfamily acetyltransferase
MRFQKRFAKIEDLSFLIEGLEQNRILEKRPKKDIPARSEDLAEFHIAIKKKNILLMTSHARPIAFLYFRTDFKVLYIRQRFFWVDLIYVAEQFRGQGLGQRLYREAIKIARQKGFKKIIIDIFAANQNSTRFHEKMKFTPIYSIYQKKI